MSHAAVAPKRTVAILAISPTKTSFMLMTKSHKDQMNYVIFHDKYLVFVIRYIEMYILPISACKTRVYIYTP